MPPPSPLTGITALSLDLDDTLWPVKPTLIEAEQVLARWLGQHAPATARAVGPREMLALRAQVALDHPQWQHDLTTLRLETIRRALQSQGDDPALAEAAFAAFFAARHQVTLYADVRPALARLAARFRLVALSNGNAEVGRIGLGEFFVGAVTAREHGRAKPDPSIFHAACAAAGAAPGRVLHLGDDTALDVAAALAAGLHGGWIARPDHPALRRGEPVALPAGAHAWPDLAAVADALGC